MAGTKGHVEKYVRGHDNKQFHMEMGNVTSATESYPALQQSCHAPEKPRYVPSAPASDPWGSDASFDSRYPERRADAQPLTEPHPCRYEECRKFHATGGGVSGDPDGPESPLKNVLLYLVIIMFLVWIFVYAILNRLKYL